MSKLETDHDFYSINQVTIALLLLAMVLMRDSIDNEIVQAVCLACLLSLLIKEAELCQDKDSVSEVIDNTETAFDEEHTSYSDSPAETSEYIPSSSTSAQHSNEESGLQKQSSPEPEIPSYRRPVEVYSSIPGGTGTTHQQAITWKPMPPKSIVPTKHPQNKEAQNLSIRFGQ